MTFTSKQSKIPGYPCGVYCYVCTCDKDGFTPYESPNFYKLRDSLYKEMNRVSVWPGSTVDNTISEFNDIARKIADLPFSECVVEFLMQDGFRITLTFDNGKMLLLNFPVFAMKEGIVVYSFFIYRELIACDYCKTEDFISGFNKYL